MECNTNYIGEVTSSPDCAIGETTFNFQGCSHRGTQPLVVDFSVGSRRVCHFQLEDGYEYSNGESYSPGSYRYNYFNNVDVECTNGFERVNPDESPQITCPVLGNGRFIFQGCRES